MTKPIKWPVHLPSLKKTWVLSYLVSTQWRLRRCASWSESSLGAHHFVGFVVLRLICQGYTGHPRYVDFAYLDTTTCRGDFSLPTFFSVFLCISTPSMSKTVNLKQRVSRGDFLCPRHILYYICYCLCRSENWRSCGRNIVCFGYVDVLAEVRTSSKQQ